RDRRAGAIELPTLAVPLGAAALDPVRIPAVRAELPGLAEALDGDGMRPRLEALLRDGYELERCAVDKIQYLPGEACVVRYEVGIRHAASGRLLERVVTARALPGAAGAPPGPRPRGAGGARGPGAGGSSRSAPPCTPSRSTRSCPACWPPPTRRAWPRCSASCSRTRPRAARPWGPARAR